MPRLPLFFARRYLFSRKSHSVINIISGVSAFSVAVPVMAMVSVFERRQPERVEYFVDKSGTEEIVTKENWDLEYDVDMNELFGPITMERMQEKIRRDEQARLREIAKKRAEQEKNGRQSSAAGGNRNNSNNYNGYGNTGGLGGTGGMIRR